MFCIVSLMLAAACDGGPAPEPASPTQPPPGFIGITIDGEARTVAQTSSLGAALKSLGLNPRPGRLLDVRGDVLKPGAYPAKVLVNGKRAKNQTPLHAGDVVQIIPGADHTEPTFEKRVTVPPQPLNPEYRLGAAPGQQVTTIGKESGKIGSVIFDPSGPAHRRREIALTFDDGPNPTYTPKVLKVLRRFHVHATFFLIGYEAEKYPDLVRKEIAQGHVVGTHSWNHPTPFASLGEAQLERQFSQTDEVMTRLGIDPYLFKPPGGSFSPRVVEMARRHGMRTVMWSADTHDYTGKTAKEIAKYVLKHLEPGAIVLMHDGGGDRSATVKALPDIIRGARKRGYDLVSIAPNG